MNHDLIQRYIARIEDLTLEREDELTEGDLAALARELGVSDEELAAARRDAEEQVERGLGFIEHGLLDDAVSELTMAAAVLPYRLSALEPLAKAYGMRWLKTQDHQDRDRAETLCRRCLAMDPSHDPSYVLLRTLQHESGSRWHKAAGTVIAVMVLIMVAVFLQRTRPDGERPVYSVPAQSGTGVASSSYHTHRPELAFDGDTTTFWWTSGATTGQWITVELAEASVCTGLSLYYDDVVSMDYSLQGRLNPKDPWQPLATNLNAAKTFQWTRHNFDNSKPAKYYRIQFDRGTPSNAWLRLREVKLSGIDGQHLPVK